MYWYYKNHEIELRQQQGSYKLLIDKKQVAEEKFPLANEFVLKGKIYEDNYIEGKKDAIAMASVTVNQLRNNCHLRVDTISHTKSRDWGVDGYRYISKAEWTECGDENIQKYGGILIRPHLNLPLQKTPSEYVNTFDIVSVSHDDKTNRYNVVEAVFDAKDFLTEYKDLVGDVFPEILEDMPADVRKNAIPIENAASVFSEFQGLIAHDNASNGYKLYEMTSCSLDSNQLANYFKSIDYSPQKNAQTKIHKRQVVEREV